MQLMKKWMCVMMAALALWAPFTFATETTVTNAAAPEQFVVLDTSLGTIRVKLFAEESPETVKNFLSYVQEGFYNDTIFHRVIPGFMVQGGGFDTQFHQKTTKAPIKNEAGNGLKNNRGTLAMARTSDPHSATAQFFINVANNDFLNFKNATPQGYGYAVFGEVVDGMDVVDAIVAVKTGSRMGHQDVPVENVVIKSVVAE